MSSGVLVVMATITHLSLVVLTTGAVVFATHGDVITERDAGTLLGPAMVLGSMATVFFALARRFGVEERDRREQRAGESAATHRILPLALTSALASFVVMLLIGGLFYASERGQPVWVVLFAGRYAASAFVVASSAWAGAVGHLASLSVTVVDLGAIDDDGTLSRWLASRAVRAVLVRPDAYVFGSTAADVAGLFADAAAALRLMPRTASFGQSETPLSAHAGATARVATSRGFA